MPSGYQVSGAWIKHVLETNSPSFPKIHKQDLLDNDLAAILSSCHQHFLAGTIFN